MILQKIIKRKNSIIETNNKFNIIDEEKESFEDFIMRVECEANIIDLASGFDIINISYPDKDTAVIVYRQLELDEEK